MRAYGLNKSLGCLFALALVYLNLESEPQGHLPCWGSRNYDPEILGELEDYGLICFSANGDGVYLTEEGRREARGILKYLQLELGPKIGADLRDIRYSDPELLAEEVAYGAGPLTMPEIVYALAGVKRSKGQGELPLVTTALSNPPAEYGRDPIDTRAFQLNVELVVPVSGNYYRSSRTCWRSIIVPAGFTFLDLHLIIQDVFCWQDSQPFGFLLTTNRKNLLIGERDVLGEIALPKTGKKRVEEAHASELRLSEVFPRTRFVTYRYGTKTDWTHSITFEAMERGVAKLGPQLLDGAGDAPPEWAEGPEDFEEFRNGLYESRRFIIRRLSKLGERGYAPFGFASVRKRLEQFEQDRARWQGLLDEARSRGKEQPQQ